MATATMGLRRRVQVGSSSAVVAPSGGPGKRTRSENNNSPSQGNLNSLDAEPAPKRPRGSLSISTRSKAKELELAKKVSSNGLPLWPESRNYASIAGLSLGAQQALCSESVGLPAGIPYMSSTMATFVGNATSLGKSPGGVSYLDISNMTARAAGWPADAAGAVLEPKAALGLPYGPPFAAAVAAAGAQTAQTAAQSASLGAAPAEARAPPAAQPGPLPKSFPDDAMFAAYQPWVIKTYGDLAKTKTITIKKYARILRTLRGEEVNSAENSKFRFWVKSKGFHVGQPEGYEAKPADRIVGRHAVSSPGLDPPLYVPTQPPHNKALNGAEGTVPSGRVYKKVAIVENFFDIIHAVHVDLEGRPGKHAGQKRTYRTITETYAFLPREAVTRFLLGCTECQRRPRTPSPASLVATANASGKPDTPTPASTPTPPTEPVTPEAPPSPQPAASLPCGSPEPEAGEEKPKEEPPEIKSSSPSSDCESQPPGSPPAPCTSPAPPATPSVATSTATPVASSPSEASVALAACTTKFKDEKYNPLSITNLLRKDPVVKRPPLPSPSSLAPLPVKVEAEEYVAGSASTVEAAPSFTPPPRSVSPPVATAIPRKLRILQPDCARRSTPSPLSGQSCAPSPWGAGLDPIRCALPLDYSLPLGVHYPQPRLLGCPGGEPRLFGGESDPEAPEAERGLWPAAGLIDTNLNLLATIQQLHCQVMLALTERLRPAEVGSPAVTMTTSAAAAAAPSPNPGAGNDS